jgi:DNA-binding NarL/FixJ family response regulator
MVAHQGTHDIRTAHRSVLAPIDRRWRGCIIVRMSRTVLIVDDHAEFRASARALLEASGFIVIGEAADGAEAVRLTRELRPAVVLLDIALPDMDGFAVADRLAADDLASAVVLVSSRERSAYGRRIGVAPIRGFLSKRQLSGPALMALLA